MELWTAGESSYGSLFVKQCGHEMCSSGHRYGPAVRDYHLIHFVASGRGSFETPQGVYNLQAGQLFIIFPDQVTVYSADTKDPWTYAWVGYSGDDAASLTRRAGLSADAPVLAVTDTTLAYRLLHDMVKDATSMRLGGLSALGGLYRFLALIGESAKRPLEERESYYEKALWYMQGHYERGIGVDEVAGFMGLSRSQLFRVFKQASGLSPKQMLTAIRARRARTLMETTSLTTEEVAESIGVSSPARLNELLNKTYGTTALKLRKEAGV